MPRCLSAEGHRAYRKRRPFALENPTEAPSGMGIFRRRDQIQGGRAGTIGARGGERLTRPLYQRQMAPKEHRRWLSGEHGRAFGPGSRVTPEKPTPPRRKRVGMLASFGPPSLHPYFIIYFQLPKTILERPTQRCPYLRRARPVWACAKSMPGPARIERALNIIASQGGVNMRHFHLTPLYRSTIGFDRLGSLLDTL